MKPVRLTGYVRSVTAPGGARTAYTPDKYSLHTTAMHLYDAGNTVLATVGYTYIGDRLRRIAAPGTTYTFSYDALGRSTKLHVGSRVLASYAYLPSELLGTLTYGNGAKVSYRYDGLGRQIEKAFGDDGTQVLQTTYNDRGQVGLIRDGIADTHTRYTYDLAGRVIGIQKLRGKATAPDAQLGAVEYVYEDGTARLKSQKAVTPFGEDTLTLTYGSLANGTSPDRVAYINGSHFGQINYLYDDLGRLACRNLWDAHLFTQYTYEDIGTSGRTTTRISSVTSGGTTLNYTYDADGRIKTVKNGDTLVESYTYDTFGRLSTAFGPSVMSAYSYDTNGNLTEKNEKGVTTTYAYTDSTWGDLLTNYNGTLLYYDQIGNPLYWRDGMTMGWRNGRQLAYVGRVGTEKKTTYAYGADGVRTQKTVDGVTTEYYTVGGKLLAEKTGDRVLTFYYDDQGAPVSVELNGTRYYYHRNLQGDVIGLYIYTGAQVVSYTYDPWGKLLSVTDTSGTDIGTINPLRYRGYYYDTETGFYFLQSRYYDPTVGRFITPEPNIYTGAFDSGSGLAQYNAYAYCANDPVNFSDDTGEFIVTAVIIGSAVAGGLISGTISAITQYATTGEINIGVTLVNAASGLVSGALAATGIGLAASIAANAALGGATYMAEQAVTGEEITASGVLIGVAAGGISGAIGGKGADTKKLCNVWKSASKGLGREARRANTKYAAKQIAKYTATKIAVKTAIKTAVIRYTAGVATSSYFSTVHNRWVAEQ